MEFQEPKIENVIDATTFYNKAGTIMNAFYITGERNDIILSDKVADDEWEDDMTFQEYPNGTIPFSVIKEFNSLTASGYESKVALPDYKMFPANDFANIRVLLKRLK